MGQLDAKVAIITGGGGHIGRGIARAFVKEGAKVFLADRYAEAAKAAVDEIESLGGEGLAGTYDVSDEAQVLIMVEKVIEHYGSLDILINNAQSWTGGAKAHLGSPIEELPEAWWDESFDTGVTASWFCCKAAFPYMKDTGGKIVNFGSIMGIVGWEGAADYNANKEAIRALTRTAAVEWGKYGINVNTICPSSMTVDKVLGGAGVDPQQWIEERVALLPMRRIGDPEKDIGRVAVFLCSQDANYITGQTFMVDGGAHML